MLFVFLVLSCATAPYSNLLSSVPKLKTVIANPQPERGNFINAIVLQPEPIGPVLDMLKPEVLAMKIDVKPIIEAGFFKKLDLLKPMLSPIVQIRIHYWSADAQGRPLQLSGLLCLPAGSEHGSRDVPLLLICHGTQVLRDRVPSRLAGSERPLALLAAASGVAVALPDYPGMGDGEGFHPYCHAASIANSGVDFLRAVILWLESPEAARYYRQSGIICIGGYSEGGFGAMAVLKQIETRAKKEFPITACFPMAGPFDMSGIMRNLMAQSEPISSPYYLPYTILGWHMSHPQLKPSEALKPEYIDALLPLFDGRNSARTINTKITELQKVPMEKAVASRMLTEKYLNALIDPGASELGRLLISILKENDLYDWSCDPAIPIHFMATVKDELVPFQNSVIAYETMKSKGANATFRILNQSTHENGAYEGYAVMLLEVWKLAGI